MESSPRPAAADQPVFQALEARLLLSAAPKTDGLLALADVSLGAYVAGQGAWLDFDTQGGLDAGSAASVDLFGLSGDGLTGQVTVHGAWLDTVMLKGSEFTRLALPESGTAGQIGQPALPVIRTTFVAPQGAVVTAEVVGDAGRVPLADLGADDWLLPVQASVPKVPGALAAAPLDLDAAAYQVDAFGPQAQVRVVEAGTFAGQRLVMLEISPIAYNPVRGELQVHERLSFDVRFDGGEAPQQAVSDRQAAALASLATNYTPPETTMTTGRFLIVAHDDLMGTDLTDFAAHKAQFGWTVDLVDTTTAGTTAAAIRSYIRSRYDNLPTRPDAVLLVGDTNRIPHFDGQGTGTPDTDLYYGCMDDGDDWYPELAVGRFSVAGTGDLADVIAKTIEYELEVAPSGDWMTQATFMTGQDNYQITEGTHNWVVDTYMDPLGYTSDKLYMVTYGATTQDVRDAFNAGRVYGIYSGHGSTTSWADGPPFSQADVNGLTNDEMYPFVCSFACSTGNYTYSECFAETWLRADSGGAVAVWASSVSSYWTEDDILEKRLFEAIYDEQTYAFADATVRAKELYLDHFGPTSTTRRYFEMYNFFGDPTVELAGQELRITSPSELPPAYLDEYYEYTLQARSGAQPYSWSLIDGALPVGMSVDPGSGVISGTPTALGAASFTIEVTDDAQQTDSRLFSLPVVEQLQITTAPVLPDGAVGSPYSVVLAAQGGTQPYEWSVIGQAGYGETGVPPAYVGGGAAQGWHNDDQSWLLALPWDFTFYGSDYDSVYVCTNGFIDFASGSAECSNSQSQLIQNVRIAPLWDDLRTDGIGEDIYVAEGGDYVAIRWDARTFSGSHPVDAEVVLFQDGRIRFNYGEAHSGLTPTIGISAGDGTNYAISLRDGSASIPANVSSEFVQDGPLPPGLSLDGATGEISGTPTQTGEYVFEANVTDSGAPQQTDNREFTLTIVELVPLTVDLPAAATEGDGLLVGQGTVSIPAGLGADLEVALASDDASELSLPAAVTIPAGLTSAPFDLSVVDDAILDGSRLVTVTASADGHNDGQAAMSVHDNETAVLTVAVPSSAVEGDGVLPGAGSVTASSPVDEDVVVALSTDDATEAAPQALVTILAGQASAAFDLEIIDDGQVDGAQAATITAHVANWTDGADAITVDDDDDVLTVLVPGTVWEGDGVLTGAGTVTIGGTLGDDLVVSLLSGDASELEVPASVTIPAGQTFAPFDVIVQDDDDQDGAQTVSVDAAAAGLTPGSGQTVVGDDEIHHFAFDSIGDPQQGSEAFTVTIIAKDLNGETIEVYDGQVDLTGAGDGGYVPVEVDPEPPASPSGQQVRVVSPDGLNAADQPGKTLGTYHDYAELTAALIGYAAAYPDVTRLVSVGQSVQGRELWALEITDEPDVEEDEPEVKYVSTMHGNEPVGTETCLYFIDYLLAGYGSDPRVTDFVDGTEIWILPLMNPDGREAGDRENAHGIDLNRAFPDGAVDAIGNIFDGPAMDTTGREPEVAAVMEWSAAASFSLSANFHTGALVVNYPYDNDGLGSVDSPTPDDELFENVSMRYSVHNPPMWNSPVFPNGITNGAAWYSITGGMQDWNYRYLSCNEVTIELSDVKWPAEATLPGFWADNQESMMAYLEAVHIGVRGVVTDAMTGLGVYASVEVVGNAHPVFTDPDVGDYHRMLLPGTYDLVVSAPGYAPQTVENVVVVDGAATVADVELVPLPEGVVLTDGVWTGQVAVHALDTGVVLTADDGQGHTGTSNAFDVVHGELHHLTWDEIGSPRGTGLPFDVTVRAMDAHGYLVADFAGPVELSGSVGFGDVTIGTGTGSWFQPMNTYWHDSRTQVIYLGSEIGAAGTITSLALDVTTVPGQIMNNWTIRMKHTPLESYSPAAWESAGWSTVYQSNESVTSTGWVAFDLTTPFDYDGQQNLMVDFSHNNSSYTTEGMCRCSDTGVARTVYAYTDSGYGDPLGWSGTSSPTPNAEEFIPNIRLTGGADVPITPTMTGTFAGGVWQGQVTVLDSAENMNLLADDGAGHVGASNLFTVVTTNLAPLAVDLAPGSDTGQSDADDITRRDNSAPPAALEFVVAGTIPGAMVRLYADGECISDAVEAAGTATTLVTNGAFDLADGLHAITARQGPPGGPESTDSPTLDVWIDTFGPRLGWGETAKLLAGDGEADDEFGEAVALAGDFALVGASGDDDLGLNAGAAYLFERTGAGWVQVAKLLPDGGQAGDSFGYSVALSGPTAVVGAPHTDAKGLNEGAVYVFQHDGAAWEQVAELRADDAATGDQFGRRVAVDGQTVLVGAVYDDDNGSSSGSAYVFRYDGTAWEQAAKLLPDDGDSQDRFGCSVSVSGETALIGARRNDDHGDESGSAYVFGYNGQDWEQLAKLLPDDGAEDDEFGGAVSIRGQLAVIGADGDDDSGTGSGSAYVFADGGEGWGQLAKLLPTDGAERDAFGCAVSMGDGRLVIGADGHDDDAGSAYVFEDGPAGWVQMARLLAGDAASDDAFAAAVAIDGETALVGSPADDDSGGDSGSAYVFSGVGWRLTEDTGADADDKLTRDTTPELTFWLTEAVYGADGDVDLRDPDDVSLAIDPVGGWGTSTLSVSPAAMLTLDGAYSVILSGAATIEDVAGNALNDGDNEAVAFTLDTQGPLATAMGLSSTDGDWALGVIDSSVWTAGPAATAPWFTIDRLVLDFDEAVVAEAAHLAVEGALNGAVAVAAFEGSGAERLTWTLAGPAEGSLDLDRYAVVLSGEVTDLAGNALAGAAVTGIPTSPSPGDVELGLNVLPGDADQDGRVKTRDWRLVRGALGSKLGQGEYSPLFDMDGDGRIATYDWRKTRTRLGTELPAAAPQVASEARSVAVDLAAAKVPPAADRARGARRSRRAAARLAGIRPPAKPPARAGLGAGLADALARARALGPLLLPPGVSSR